MATYAIAKLASCGPEKGAEPQTVCRKRNSVLARRCAGHTSKRESYLRDRCRNISPI